METNTTPITPTPPDRRGTARTWISIAAIGNTIYAVVGIIAGFAVGSVKQPRGYFGTETHPFVWHGIGLGIVAVASATVVAALLAFLSWKLEDDK